MRAAGRSRADIASELGRSFAAIRTAPRRAPAERTQKIWTEEETARLTSLRAQGMTVRSIADNLQRSLSSVEGKLKRESRGEEIRLKRRTNALQTVYEPRPWTEDETQKLVDMRKTGLEIREIARTLGRSAGSVSRRLEQVKRGVGCRRVVTMPHEDELLAQSRSAGMTWNEIHVSMPQRSAESWRERFYANQAQTPDTKIGLAWSQEDIDQVHKLRADGMKRADIARALGRSLGSVDSVFKDHRKASVENCTRKTVER